MAKFYVQSGESKMVMTAADPQAAGLWMVHRALTDITPAYDDSSLTTEQRLEIAIVHGLLKFDNIVEIGEQGFDRSDMLRLDVLELIQTWHQLMSALTEMESDLL